MNGRVYVAVCKKICLNVVCKAVIYVSNADRQKDVAVILNGVGDGEAVHIGSFQRREA